MRMDNFWAKVTGKITTETFKATHPDAYRSGSEDDYITPDTQFAEDLHPGSGPAGRYRKRSKTLMMYNHDTDELFTWNDEEKRWFLWNY